MKEETRSLPWGRWLGLAMRLGITPPAFWRLSLAEWRAVQAGFASYPGVSPLGRAELDDLMRAFPDHPHKE